MPERDKVDLGSGRPSRSRPHQILRRFTRPAWLGTMRRTTPLSNEWGFDRGTPIDRYYIEGFLDRHRRDIRGRVLEVRDSSYTQRFGSGVERADVLDLDPANRSATIVADLTAADGIPSDLFDCVVLTQTLQLIHDVHAAAAHVRRILRPGGVLLATVPSVSRIAPRYGLQTDHWRFTAASCTALFGETFGPGQCTVCSFGNVLTSVGFLTGMAAQELSSRERATHDPYFPLIIAVRAVKRAPDPDVPQ